MVSVRAGADCARSPRTSRDSCLAECIRRAQGAAGLLAICCSPEPKRGEPVARDAGLRPLANSRTPTDLWRLAAGQACESCCRWCTPASCELQDTNVPAGEWRGRQSLVLGSDGSPQQALCWQFVADPRRSRTVVIKFQQSIGSDALRADACTSTEPARRVHPEHCVTWRHCSARCSTARAAAGVQL